jgi:cyanophycinase
MIKNRLLLYSCLSLLLSTQVLAQSEYNASSPNPKTLESRGPSNGKLLIIGGAAGHFFYEKFMELAGGPDAPIVVIPTALTSDILEPADLEQFRNSFIRRGFKNVTVLHTRDRKVANSSAFYEPLKSASGVWFSGGRQWRHADSYLDTKTHKAFFELLDRGGVIAGSSAGATIQGSYLARGDTKANTIMMGDHEEGLGFMTNVAIDQHLFARNRQFDLFEILHNKPGLLGIGLDENTGILVEGDQFTVIGQSYVVMYDGTRWSAERDTVYLLPDRIYQFYLRDDGDQYDLKKRRVISD